MHPMLLISLITGAVLLVIFSSFAIHYSVTKNDGVNIEFPSTEYASEFAELSAFIYGVNSCNDLDNLTSVDVKCLAYDEKPDGTEYMIVISDKFKYIAAVFTGTASLEDVIVDLGVTLKQYGGPGNETEINVHEGFNNALFENGVWDELLQNVTKINQNYSDYQLISSGHSLGGAQAILTATALAKVFPEKEIMSITYGTPMIGDESWITFANSISNLVIWRFVNGKDIVPRHPSIGLGYKQVGHTIQLKEECVAAYYLHHGDEELGLHGVPDDWDDVAIPGSIEEGQEALMAHKSGNYVEYLTMQSLMDPDKYYTLHFSKIFNSMDNFYWYLFWWDRTPICE